MTSRKHPKPSSTGAAHTVARTAGKAPAAQVSSVDLPPVVHQYLQYAEVEKRLAQRTVELYRQDLLKLQLAAAQQGVDLLQLQPMHIRRQVAQMHSKGRSGRGIALILSGWRGFYQWAVLQGLIAVNPVQDIRAPRVARPLPKALTADEAVKLAQFRQPADAQDSVINHWLELRDAAMTELLYSSGLRVGELVGLDVQASRTGEHQGRGWVDWDDAQVHVIGKGQKRRIVPVGKPAMQALQAWRSVRDQVLDEKPKNTQEDFENALFINRLGRRMSAQTAWSRLRARSQKAGLSSAVHPHMLRHSFASHVLQSSGDLRAVQELLGHANIATTQVYTRLDFQHLAKIYDSAHPRAHSKDKKNSD